MIVASKQKSCPSICQTLMPELSSNRPKSTQKLFYLLAQICPRVVPHRRFYVHPDVVQELSKGCPAIEKSLSNACPTILQRLSRTCPGTTSKGLQRVVQFPSNVNPTVVQWYSTVRLLVAQYRGRLMSRCTSPFRCLMLSNRNNYI